MEHFADSYQHLLAEMERVDLLLRAQVGLNRRLFSEDEQFRGLYISEEEVDALLDRPLGRPSWRIEDPAVRERLGISLARLDALIEQKKAESLREGIRLRLDDLRRLFGLDRLDLDILLICMGVELDLRYERLYAYLQDDVTRKRPSVDLVLGLLAPTLEDRFSALRRIGADAPLLRHQLLVFSRDPGAPDPPLIARFLKVDPRIAGYLLGSDALDERICPFVESVEPAQELGKLLLEPELKSRLAGLAKSEWASARVVVHLLGPYGAGKREAAEALCRERRLWLLVVDLDRVVAESAQDFEANLDVIYREASLQRAALHWIGFDQLLEEKHRPLLAAFVNRLARNSGLKFVAGEIAWQPGAQFRDTPFVRLELARPEAGARAQAWNVALEGRVGRDAALDVDTLANAFRLTGGQIQDAAATAENLARWRDPAEAAVSMDDLYDACRLHSNQKLASLARKIQPNYRWDDIVLPVDRLEQLREICNQVKFHERVYGDWGFGRKLAYGKGLSILFAGPSGTGKTMAADIIAGELGLDLFKIDLSTVVSKYIGETEKNLARIFGEAETSNSVLFFDEADALFGKRSEVKDSHDRYANIETGYLLQRIEEYEGVAILATNLRKNLDEAFVRRIQFTVDFPFPSTDDRRAIWEGIWPEATPLDPNLELECMAGRFEITGGNIRNIALAAAFLAADGHGSVNMEHLMRATQREYQKMGKVITEGEFGEFADRRLVKLSEHR